MPPRMFEYEKIVPPKSFGDIPRFLKELLGGFSSRFFYIIKTVWLTGKWILILKSFIAIISGLAPVIGSLLSKEILNELQLVFGTGGVGDFFRSHIFMLLIFVFVYRVVKETATIIGNSVDRIAGELVTKHIKLKIMNKTRELDLAYFDMPEFYEKLENANREAGIRPIQVISKTFLVISKFIELISYILVLATAPDLWFAVPVMLVIAIPSAVINFVYRKKTFKYLRHRSKERREMNYYSNVLVNKDMVKEIRMFDLTDTFVGKYIKVFGEYFKGVKRLILSESAWHILIGIASVIINLAFYAFVAVGVIEGKLLIGDYTLYTGAVMSIATGVSALVASSASIYEGTLFIDNLMFFMKEKAVIVPRISPALKVDRGKPHKVEFINVGFCYPGTEKYVLKNINLTFEAGQSTALVGLNGAGKTTLVKLLTRLYDPTEGQILLDGRDLRDYEVADLYNAFGIIFQDYGKYAVTVGENIAFGDINAESSEEKIKTAARAGNADEFIEKLEKSYDTPLTRLFEREGTELSVGQWQKLAVARAFYADSEILVLDEPTASLDAKAEQEIFNQFDRLREGKMTVFVSHRLSSATTAGQIVVLKNGQVVERGTHAELMSQNGEYHELFTTQAKRYIEG